VDDGVKARQVAAMERYDLDLLVAYSKENVMYGAGYPVPSQTLGINNRQFSVVANREGRAAMLLTANELSEAKARSTLVDFRPYDEFGGDPMMTLADVIREVGGTEARVGLEMDAMPVSWWERLHPLLPDVRWVNAAEAFDFARRVKSPRELDLLRASARAADQAQVQAHERFRPGMTERELFLLLVEGIFSSGGEAITMIQVAAGERSTFSNPTATDRVIERGDVVKIDVFATTGGYLSDTGRSVFVGEVTPEHRATWKAMEETLASIYQVVRPGTSTAELWQVFVSEFRSHSMEPVIRFLGHGLGISLHEEPFIAGHTDVELEAGMVFAIEPVYRVGGLGFHLEDNVIVTEDGYENMTTLIGEGPVVVGA
jgi:Xaa-Pro aminopeptidase